MKYQEVEYSVDNGVATVALNRPERLNAVSVQMYDEMRAALKEADEDESIRVIVLTGNGRGFCAGADTSRLTGIAAAGKTDSKQTIPFNPFVRGEFQDRYSFPPGMQKPVIAAVNGAAVGAGFCLAIFCDIRIAADSAIITSGFSRRGLVAEMGAAWRLDQLVGHGRATDLLFRSPKMTGKEAAAIGLVEFSVPDADFRDFVKNYATELATQVSPRSLRVIKKQLWNVPFQSLSDHLVEARHLVADSMKSEDFKEGIAHYFEKRPPRFTGK